MKVSLRGTPSRVGISWRVDEAEPSAVTLCLVIPGSPAAAAGLHVFDHVYRIGLHDVAGTEQLSRLLDESSGPTNLLVETGGRLRTATLDLPPLVPPRAQ